MSVLLATDLDLTLIYSRRALARWGSDGGALAAVETYQGVDAAFLTAEAATVLARLGEHALVVACTTRTPEQLARVRLPGASSEYAVAANGGVLLVDGVPDGGWTRTVAAAMAGGASLPAVLAHAQAVCRPEWTRLVRPASDLFCYAVLDRDALPDDLVEREAAWAAEQGWRVSLQGRKLYWVPGPLTKSAAVAEVARRAGCDRVLAAGDSLLDLDLLASADAAIAARHGELVTAGRVPAGVAVTDRLGVAAGEEIVRWFEAQVGQSPRSSPSGTTSAGA